jgi:uncharacterized membrane protein YiaA
MVRKRTSSPAIRRYLVSATAGLAVALVNYLIGLWMAARGLHAEMTFIDEILLAVFTSALVFVIEYSHRRDQERTNDKLRTIELMNHHVRNALQSIVDSAYVHGNLDEVRASVDRIAWALQEILPGERPHDDGDFDAPRRESNPGPPQAKAG